jgi:hypothetical protein
MARNPVNRRAANCAMPQVYHPDHTAHIRRRLAHMASYGLFGLLIAAGVAGITAIVNSRADGAWGCLVTAAWIADGVLAARHGARPAGHGGRVGLYRRRRAGLDAAGAEAVGELHARIANLRRDKPDD